LLAQATLSTNGFYALNFSANQESLSEGNFEKPPERLSFPLDQLRC